MYSKNIFGIEVFAVNLTYALLATFASFGFVFKNIVS